MELKVERRVYKHTSEHSEYQTARFKQGPFGSISFEWDGHRWAYRYTSFDTVGEYDLIWRPIEPSGEVAATDSAGYTTGPVSDGGMDPRNPQPDYEQLTTNAVKNICPNIKALIAQSLAAVTDREHDGFAQEMALQYGFETIDDDGEIYVCNAEALVGMMTVLGYGRKSAVRLADPAVAKLDAIQAGIKVLAHRIGPGCGKAVAAAMDEPAAQQAEPLTHQNIYGRFDFLEGLVNEQTYREIAETAINIYEQAAQPVTHADEVAQPVTKDGEAALLQEAKQLSVKAHRMGFILTIETSPDTPLAMGNYTTLPSVRPKRSMA